MRNSKKHSKGRYQVVTYHCIENGFDEKLEYRTLKEAASVASGYVDGKIEPDGFAYEGAAVYDLQKKQYVRFFGYFPAGNEENRRNDSEVPNTTVSGWWGVSFEITLDGENARWDDLDEATQEHILNRIKEGYFGGEIVMQK